MWNGKTFVLGFALLCMTAEAAVAGDFTNLDLPMIVGTSSSCTEEPVLLLAQVEQPAEVQSGDVQERAVPRLGPGMSQGTTPSTKFQGGAIQGNRLLADPGYVLESLPGNKVALKPKGGGPTIEANCICRTKGGCSFEVIGPSAYCNKSSSNPCTSNCILTVGGKLSGGQMMIQ